MCDVRNPKFMVIFYSSNQETHTAIKDLKTSDLPPEFLQCHGWRNKMCPKPRLAKNMASHPSVKKSRLYAGKLTQ